jgi:L,D-transpeptidase YbiS
MQIIINIALQQLTLQSNERVIRQYSISSAKKGVGEQQGSEQTPRGRHLIRAKIGANLPLNTVFKARRPTGEIYSAELAEQSPNRDWILTRILWLSGCEVGINRGGNCDTMRRYIYIHGTPDSEPMGIPASHGCIRMRNNDLAELFTLTPIYASVFIHE